jgi:ectoine hydroxylase-related dioxygenase (phytanoyl-CoA dioxygenase family)
VVQTASHDRVMAEIDRLGLVDAVVRLEADGLAIVPPDRLGLAPGFVDEVLARVLDTMEQRNGVRPDVTTGETHRNVFFPTLYYFLFEDPVFQEWLLNPVVLALVTYLLGESCILSTTAVFMKGPADPGDRELQLGLHTDQQMVPQPFPPYALICGATLLLTDYSKETGAFAYVPGSHKLGRHPAGPEGTRAAVPVVAPKGSLVVHHGALWHGSFPRTVPGLRAGMAFAFTRAFMTPLEEYRAHVSKELLERHPPRFATLMGQAVPTGSTETGPDLDKVYYAVARSPWD